MPHRAHRQTIVPLLISFTLGFFTAYSVLSPRTFFVNIRKEKIKMASHLVINTSVHQHEEEFHRLENGTVADLISKKVRILCWVMTQPKNHEKRAIHVKATWGKRCHKLLFMSSAKDDTLPAIALPTVKGDINSWDKTKEALKYIYQHHLHDADWFLKADDNNYVVLENLRYMLLPHSPDEAIYFGCKFRPHVKQGYMHGAAGYILSREAVKRFTESVFFNSTEHNTTNTGDEDVEMGKCLEAVNVTAGDSRDSMGRGRFFPFEPGRLLHHDLLGSEWFWGYTYYKIKMGLECCSDNAVSFHTLSADHMYSFEYLLYHLRPYGIGYKPKISPQLREPLSSTPSLIVS